MIIHDSDRQKWVRINNRTLEDKRLSYRARGILAYLLTKPKHWQVNISHLAQQSSDGITAVRSGIRELEKYGYMKKIRIRGESGAFTEHDFKVMETPSELKNFNVTPEKQKKSPRLENPTMANSPKNAVMPIENGDSDEISPLSGLPRVVNRRQVTTEKRVTTDSSLVTTEREDAISNFKKKEDPKTRSDSDGDAADRFSGSYGNKPKEKEPHERVATIPGRLKNSIFRVHFKDVLIWSTVYSLSTEQIETELRKMELWCKDNPRKLKKDMRSFVTRWLSRVSAEQQNKRMKSNVVKTNFSDGYPH